jgi:hypothetical protein
MSVMHRSEWIGELRASLRGPRLARRRLLEEIEAHLEDAIAAEVAAGAETQEAEANAVGRLGPPGPLVESWNTHALARRWAARARAVAAGVAIAAVAAPVGLAERTHAGRDRTGSPRQRSLAAAAAPAGLHVAAARRTVTKRDPAEQARRQSEHQHCRQDGGGGRESEQVR